MTFGCMMTSKINNLKSSDGLPYTYHIFFFKKEPMSIWRVSEKGDQITEFIEKVGWSIDSDSQDYRSDIDHSISTITAFYYELPITILEMLEGF